MIALLHKIDLRDVFVGHLKTLVDESSGARSWGDYGLFYGCPLVLGAALYVCGVGLSDGALSIATNVLAILAGLLFNLLVLLHGLSWPRETHPLRKTARKFAAQVYANISYSIVCSLVALVSLIVAANLDAPGRGRLITSTISTVLVVHFGLTMVMVLKRMYVILQDDFSSQDG